MVRLNEHRSNSQLEEREFLDSILGSENPLEMLTKQLQNEKCILLEINTHKELKKLQVFIMDGIKHLANALQAKARQKVNTCELENQLVVYLKVHRKLSKNSAYFKSNPQAEDNAYLQILVWSSQMELSEEVMCSITQFSFDKTMKLYYYYFKYYMSHLNLFYQNQIKIKNLFLPKEKLDFVFSHQGNQKQLHLDNLHDYVSTNCLQNCYSVASHINFHYHLGLSEDSHIFHALMVKIKIILQKNRNIVARTVIASYWIFSYIDLAWVKAGQKNTILPQMFTISPDYYQLCQQILSVFFVSQAEQATQMLVLDLIDTIQELQDRVGIKQLSVGLVDNINTVLDILNQINELLCVQKDAQEQNKKCFLGVFKKSQTMEKLLKILYNNFEETPAIHNITEEIVQKIYNRNTPYDYSENTIQTAGNILLSLEVEDQHIFQISLKQILNNPEKSSPYLKSLATLLETNYLRQRRDSGAVARRVSESQIFKEINRVLENSNISAIKNKSLLLHTILLISNVCGENPTLILLIDESGLMTTLLKKLQEINDIESIENAICIFQFMHNICLKECQFRDRALQQYLDSIVCNIFTSDIFKSINNSRQINNLWSNINRLISNILTSASYVYGGLVNTLDKISSTYKAQLNIQECLTLDAQITSEMKNSMNQIVKNDKRFSLVLKIIEKCLPQISNKMSNGTVIIIYEQLIQIGIICEKSMLSMPTQSRFLLNILADLCEKYVTVIRAASKHLSKQKKKIFSQKFIAHQFIDLNADEAEQNQAEKDGSDRKQKNSSEMEEKQIEDIQNQIIDKSSRPEQPEMHFKIINPHFDQLPKQLQERLKKSKRSSYVTYLRELLAQKKLKTVDQPSLGNEIPKYSSMLIESLKFYNKEKTPRKLIDIFFSEDRFSEEILYEAQVLYSTARIQKLLTLLSKEIGVKKFLNINFSSHLLKIQMFLPQIQHIVAMEHVEVIEESLQNLKNITIESKTMFKRNQSLQVISEEMEGNELHGQLNEKKSFYYCLVETLQRFYPKMNTELSQVFLNDVIKGYIMKLKNEVDTIFQHKYRELLSMEKCRGWIKVLLELFSGFSEEKQIKKSIQIFIFSYLIDSQENLLGMIFEELARILIFLNQQNSKYFPHNSLPNTQQNRQLICQKMMTKMILNRIHSFIIYCLIDFDYFIDEAPPQSKNDRVIISARYIEKYIREYSKFFMELSKVVQTMKLNLKQIFVALHAKIKYLSKHQIWQEERLSELEKQKREEMLIIKNRIDNETRIFHEHLLDRMVFPDLLCDYRIPIIEREDMNLKEKYETSVSLENLYHQANKQIMRIAHQLFPDYKITFGYNRKIVQAIYDEKVDYETVNIKEQIKHLNNVLWIIHRIILKIDRTKEFFGGVSFNYGYMNELIRFITLIIKNSEKGYKNDEYSYKMSELVRNILLIVRIFGIYCVNKEEQEAIRKKMKRKEKRKLKKKSKNEIKEQKVKEKEGKGEMKWSEKRQKDKKKQEKKDGEEKVLRRDKSKINLVSTPHKLQEMDRKNINLKKTISKSQTDFSQNLKQLIKSSLQISSKFPFLRNLTLQLIMFTINTFMIKDDHPNKQQKNRPRKIELDSLDILPSLLKTKINQIQHQGFFHLLSEMGVQLIDNHEIMVKAEMGLKRIFYEKKSNEIEYRDFKRCIGEYLSLDAEVFGNFLNLKYKDKEEEKMSPFSKKFIKSCKDKSLLFVVLKENSPLNVISYHPRPHNKKKKSEIVQNEEQEHQQIKSVDYIPSKAMSTYIHQLIQHIIRLMIRGLVETQQKQMKMVDEKQESDREIADPFNITVLVESLQVVMRWSPCLTPYITKFKCRKMISQVMSQFTMSEGLRQFIISKVLSLDDKKQITFLAVLIRGVTPLFFNKNFTIIFQMCLDNTILQKQKNLHSSITNEAIYIPFGQVVRQRVIMEIEDELKKTPFIIKKLTLLNLLTTLISIKQFAAQCIDNVGLTSTLHDNFSQVFRKMRDNKVKNLSFISKNVVIPFFLSPISLLQQLSISLQIDKKRRPNRNIPIGFELSNQKVEHQILEGQFFKIEKKFRQNWPYIGLLDYPQFADQSEIDESSIDSSSSLLNSSANLGDIPPPDQFDDFQLSQLNSHIEHQNSWVQNEVSNSAGYLHENSPMELNLYPLPGVDDSIIEDEDEEDENLLSDPSNDDFSSQNEGDSPLGESSVINLISQSTISSAQRQMLRNSRGIDLYEDFDNVISYDRTDQNNPIYRTEKEQENLLHDLLLLYGGNTDKKILKMEPIKQIFDQQLQLISYCGHIEFENFSKFESTFWMPPKIFKVIKDMEDQIFIPSGPIARQLKQLLNIQSNTRRNRLIFDNNNDNLMELNREVELMRPQQIVEEINRVQRPQEQENEDEQRNREMERYIEQAMREGEFMEEEYQEHPEISNQQLENRLREQGFSMQSYRNLPRDIREDIINNILEQNRRNEEFASVNERQREQGQVVDEQSSPSQMEEESLEEISPVQHFNSEEQNSEGYAQSHKRISFEHSQKISKDRFFMLNKDGKNDHKFIECSDQFLYNLFDLMLFTLNDSDFIYFPYEFLRSLCINSVNQLKILSTLVGILLAGPNHHKTSTNSLTLPITKIVTDNEEIQQNYSRIIFPALSLKILYTLHYLSKEYALAITMLNPIFQPISHLDLNISTLQNKSILELIISLLRYSQLEHQNLNHLYLIKVINNLTLTNFNYHIFTMYSDKDKAKIHQVEKQKNMTTQLSSQSNQLICDLLQNNELKDDRHLLSQIIMRLSLNQSNVSHFIKHFHQLIKDLASKTLTQLKQISHKSQLISKTQHHKVNFKEKVLKFYSESKIVQLLNMFYEIMKSFRMALPAQDKTKVIDELKKVLLCEEIKMLCETGCQIIVSDPSAPQLVAKVHEFMDCFFAIYNILKVTDNENQKKNEKIKIASLSKISNKIQLNKKHSSKKKFISDFIDLGYLWDKKICTAQGKAFVNANIKNKLTSLIKNMKREGESLLDIPIIDAAIETPYMLEFENKKMLFKAEIKRLKYKKAAHSIYLLINREEVFQQSFTEIMSKRAEQLKGKLQVQFEGEQGEDAGGLTRQWYQLLSKQMFNPMYALFTPSSTGNTYQPSSKSYVNEQHEKYFKFIGRVMGKALHDGFLLDAYFTPAFYKHILSLPISYEDMEEEDYEFFNSLKWILNNSPIQDYLELFFTYEFDNFGIMETRQLCQKGEEKLVTEENKEEYVELVSYAKMATAVQKQLESFLEGFHDIIPRQLVRIFDEKELEIMISGLPTIDIDDLKRNTDLVNYNKTDQIIVWLFEVLEEFDMGLRTSFLQFVTGTSRVPSEGFKGLQGFNGPQKFNIHKDFESKHLPRAHTCFNQLDLPNYESKQILIEKLTLAITEGKQGFGMI